MSHGVFGDDLLDKLDLDELDDDEIIEYVYRKYNVKNVVVNRFEYNGKFAKHDHSWKSEIPDRMSGFICSTIGFVLICIQGFDPIIYYTNDTSWIVTHLALQGMKQKAIAAILNITQSSVSKLSKKYKR